ncbi:unnamed protein product [Rotaria sordida]|uniref:Uncharacterized protein n=1 Tax=Rotaria sordida TaxID=392033 RepID=A0A816DZD6_9BILA|nr:unnamed protein product [Rotaria sordida]CAF1643334.1 unnamed protein product [Rotaria sordida]
MDDEQDLRKLNQDPITPTPCIKILKDKYELYLDYELIVQTTSSYEALSLLVSLYNIFEYQTTAIDISTGTSSKSSLEPNTNNSNISQQDVNNNMNMVLNTQNDELISSEKHSTDAIGHEDILESTIATSMDTSSIIVSSKNSKKRVKTKSNKETIRSSSRIQSKRLRLS